MQAVPPPEHHGLPVWVGNLIVAFGSSFVTVLVTAWRMGFTSGKGESRLAVKLEELETRLGEVQANLKELSDAFGDFQEHRIQDLDERYVQAHTCAIVQKMVTDKIAMLPALLMADEQFRNMIRQEVRNGMNAAIAHDVRRQS